MTERIRAEPSTKRGEFGIGTMKCVKNAITKLARVCSLLDDAARRAICTTSTDTMELERLESIRERWKLCYPVMLPDLIAKMNIWKLSKRKLLDAHKAMAKGGIGRSKFNAPDALGRCLEDLELHCLAGWTGAARYTDQTTHRRFAWLRLKVLAPECFLARPAEITRLRLPQIKCSDYSGCLGSGAKLWKLELPCTKGSQDTTYPLSRFALRHRDVRCCAVSALAEALYTSYHLDSVARSRTPLATLSSHAFAKTSACDPEDAQVYLKQPDRHLKAWHLELVLSSKRCSREPMSEKETRKTLKRMREMECNSTEGITEAFSAKLLHRRSISVTKATALGASEYDLRSLGHWNAADSLRDAYLHGAPPVTALMAVAGCDARTGLYYTEYDRDRMPVPESLLKRLWPWVEAWQDESRRLRDYPSLGFDHKLDTFLKALVELRIVFYQDMAMMRAFELESDEGALRHDWSFWETDAFVNNGEPMPEWLALVEDARERIRSGPRMPSRMKFDTDFVARDVVASLASHAGEVGELKARQAVTTREVRAMHAQLQECETRLDAKLDDLLALLRSGAAIQGSGAVMQATTRSPSLKDQPQTEWEPLLEAVQPRRLDEDVVKAADAWQTLKQFTFTKEPKQFKDVRYRYGAFYRCLETYASSRDEPRDVALRRLEATRLKLDKQTLASIHALFFEALKKAREEAKAQESAGSGSGVKGRATNRFIVSFVARLNDLVDGSSDKL